MWTTTLVTREMEYILVTLVYYKVHHHESIITETFSSIITVNDVILLCGHNPILIEFLVIFLANVNKSCVFKP